ncbi:TetR/AcrR family transcriptional regulator [Aquabacterium sp.]|uniref:TetR/AcrR family transcriptional regulator n=1 Tax=Aquabacterium sp. TaxID=1872578 RepID=UPI0035AFD0D6
MNDLDRPASPRAQARREQVLEAASECFRRKGFHGASMAEIAKTAGMSPGHIYNLFTNKEDIIGAIVARDQSKLDAIAQGMKASGDVRAAMLQHARIGVSDVTDPASAALSQEVLAEAGRNPKVAEIVQAADARWRAQLQDLLSTIWLREGRPVPPDIAARTEMLTTIFKGLTARAIYHPGIDRDAVAPVVQRVLAALMQD